MELYIVLLQGKRERFPVATKYHITKTGHTEGEVARIQIMLLLQYYNNFTRFGAQYDWSFQAFFR